ncbi:MAG: TetR/AcrR family transcriptional regulator [Sterolibacterium sp.]
MVGSRHSDTPDTAKAPARRRKEARPGELTAAALALFVERGFAATRLDDIAERAGVSKGTLYLYFDSKEALFKAVIREGVVPAIEAGEAMLKTFRDDPERLLRELLFGWWQMLGSTPIGGIPKLMIAEGGNFPEVNQFYFDEVITRAHRLCYAALELGVAKGVFRPVDIEAQIQVILAPLLMLAIWKHSFACCAGSEVAPQRYLEATLDLILNGLRQAGQKPGETR